MCHTLSAYAVVIHYEEALYQVYAAFTFTLPFIEKHLHNMLYLCSWLILKTVIPTC